MILNKSCIKGKVTTKTNIRGHLTTKNDVCNSNVIERGPAGKDGEKGDPGADGNGILSILKTATTGIVDTYTIFLQTVQQQHLI